MTLQCKGLAVACSNAAVRRLCSNQKTRSSESIHGLCERTESFFSLELFIYTSLKNHIQARISNRFLLRNIVTAPKWVIHALKLRTKLTLCTNTNGIKTLQGTCKSLLDLCHIHAMHFWFK